MCWDVLSISEYVDWKWLEWGSDEAINQPPANEHSDLDETFKEHKSLDEWWKRDIDMTFSLMKGWYEKEVATLGITKQFGAFVKPVWQSDRPVKSCQILSNLVKSCQILSMCLRSSWFESIHSDGALNKGDWHQEWRSHCCFAWIEPVFLVLVTTSWLLKLRRWDRLGVLLHTLNIFKWYMIYDLL